MLSPWFTFPIAGAISNATSLLTYDTQYLLHNFFYGPKHNVSFVPVLSAPEEPSDPLAKDMALLCHSDPFCRFDVLTTRDLAVGNSTKWSHQNHQRLQESLRPGEHSVIADFLCGTEPLVQDALQTDLLLLYMTCGVQPKNTWERKR